MNPERLFLADGSLRPVWRFFLAVVVVFAAYVFAGEVARLAAEIVGGPSGPWVAAFWGGVATLAAVLAGFKVLASVFDRRPLRSMGLTLHSRWGKELGHGLALGAAMLLIVVVPEWGCGFAKFALATPPTPGVASFTLVFLALAAANEEIVFRGYPFQRLVECLTPAGAVAASSVLFGLLHLSNPHHTWFSTVNTALVGIPFALAYLRTRALWMPIGIHFIWNSLMGFGLGLPVSGINFPSSILRAQVSGQAWLTGGEYGPEGGALVTVTVLAATVYLLVSKHVLMTEEMRALVFAPVAPREPEPPISIFSA